MYTTKWPVLLLLAATLSFVSVSCKKKKEDNTGLPANLRELLVGKKWQVVSEKPDREVDIDGDGKPDSDFHKLAMDCELDDYTVFEDNGSVVESEGNDVCTETPPAQIKWALTDNSTAIAITMPDEQYVMKISSIDANILVVTKPYLVSGISIIVTTTFKKI
ncbi:MAG: lipocalin family protein [Chitinophagaceae bacterium]|nr:lipocalin family protein [Chitinophagaceae bacterium]